MSTKKLIFLKGFFADYFLKVHLNQFSKIEKVQKKSQNSKKQGFSYCFCLLIEGSGSGAGFGAGSGAGFGSGSKPLTNGPGSGRAKNMWIRIQIRNTAF
jgi:hypothetical protein